MSEPCSHFDDVRLCPDCGGLVVQRFNHVGSAEIMISWVDGRIDAWKPVELYASEPVEACEEQR